MPQVCIVTGGSGVLGHAVQVMAEKMGITDTNFVFLSQKDGDCRNIDQMRKIFEKHHPTHIIHLAARVGGLYANMNDNVGFLIDNQEMTLCILKLCHEFKVQHGIFCLSTCVFPTNAPLPLTEDVIHDGPPHFSNVGYSVAKRDLEILVSLYRQKYGYDWICVIPTNLYGPNDNFNVEAGHVLPGLIHKCYLSKMESKPFVIFGSGKPLRQFLYSMDAAKIILELLFQDASKLPYNTIILCDSGKSGEVTISEAASQVVAALKFEGEVKYDTSRADGAFRKTASNSRLLELLGSDYKFTSLEQGIQETADWFVKNFSHCRK